MLKIVRLTEMECTKQVLGQAYFSPLTPLSSEDQKRTKGLQLSSIALPPKYNVVWLTDWRRKIKIENLNFYLLFSLSLFLKAIIRPLKNVWLDSGLCILL